MQRILVDVNVPGAGTHYEVRIPDKIYIYKLTNLLIKAFDSLVDEDFNPSGAVLCYGATGEVVDINLTVKQAGIVNGTELLLI